MSVTCVKEIHVCSENEAIEQYWKSLKEYSRYIKPYAIYAKWTEYVLKDPQILIPEMPIKRVNFNSDTDFYISAITYIVYKILRTDTPFSIYYDGFEFSPEPLDFAKEIYIEPSQINPADLPVIMETLVQILKNPLVNYEELEGIKIKNTSR